MPRVAFTANVQRIVPCPPVDVGGATVRDVLHAAFAANPAARDVVLDEQGKLRRHVVVFVAGRTVKDREGLSDPVPEGAEVYVMQALSGG